MTHWRRHPVRCATRRRLSATAATFSRLHGLRIPAVALMGTSVSVQQLERLAHASAGHITVLLDGDEAGREAAEKVAGAIANVAWCRIVHLPDGVQPDTVDPAELERRLGRSQER